MFRKLFIGLAPLLAIAAFAVMPVTAQALNHWYRSGVILPAGTVVPVNMWGNKINVNQTSGVGEYSCRTAGGGMIENSPTGGPGLGRIDVYAFYDCTAPQCEKEVLEKFGTEGRGLATAINLPSSVNGLSPRPEESAIGWRLELQEETLKIGEPFLKFEEKSPPGMIRVELNCEIAASKTVTGAFIFEGELTPEIGVTKKANWNGSSPAKPSQFHFEGPASGALHSMAAGLDTFVGAVKYQGYNEQEVITVKP